MTAILVSEAGQRPGAEFADVEKAVASGKIFWLDIVGESESARLAYLTKLRLAGGEIAWALRFGQTGRMHIGRERLRTVTWIAGGDGVLIEVHLIGWAKGLVTLWSGDPANLDRIRRQFADQAGGFEDNPFHAAGILLQLLLGTLDAALHSLDARIDELRLSLDNEQPSADFSLITRRLQQLQTFAAGFSRDSSAVRSATIGVEIAPGVGPRGAAELNDYVDQVEDFEEQLYERRRWMSDITHDFATAIAQRQSEQIARLTLVSMVFLPVTALTGFFGMNFDWMIKAIAGGEAFLLLGVIAPALSVVLTFAWLSRRGLAPFRFRR